MARWLEAPASIPIRSLPSSKLEWLVKGLRKKSPDEGCEAALEVAEKLPFEMQKAFPLIT